MSNRNRSSGVGGQAPPPTNFIEHVFGKLANQVWIGSSDDMNGGFYDRLRYVNLPDDQAHYICQSLMKVGSRARNLSNFAAGVLVVLDDVMAIMAVGNPKQVPKDHVDTFLPAHKGCYVVETSKGNFQYGWCIEPETDFDRWNYFLEMLKLDPVYGASARQGDPVHYYRTSTGTNPKNGFKTRLVQKYDGFEWKLDDLAAHFGIDMSAGAIAAWTSVKPILAATEYASADVLRDLLDLIPNDKWFDDRTRWASIGFALKNASNDDPSVKELWIDWDKPGPRGSDAERFWETAHDPKAGLSTLRREIERRYGQTSVQRKLAAQIIGREVFGDIPDDDVASIMPVALKPVVITAKPFIFGDPKLLKPRDWLYGTAYLRRFVFGLVSPGGVGKTSLTLVEAVAMASGKELLGVKPRKRLKVWVWNGEDPLDEMERRLFAIMLHYGLTQADIDGYLFLSSGRDTPIVLATSLEGGAVTIQRPVREAVLAEIGRLGIDVMVLDPFISSHAVPENANDAIDKVVKEWAAIADQGNCAILLPHHVRKSAGGTQGTAEPSADDARGATAYRDALRGLRVAAPISAELRDKVVNPRAYFRVVDAKLSMAPARDTDDHYRFVSVSLGNGDPFPADGGDAIPDDSVGVVVKWTPPSLQVGMSGVDVRQIQDEISKAPCRESIQSPDWVGKVIAATMGIDLGLDAKGNLLKRGSASNEQYGSRSRVLGIIKDWIKSGRLKTVTHDDADGKERIYVETGEMDEPLENVIENDDPEIM